MFSDDLCENGIVSEHSVSFFILFLASVFVAALFIEPKHVLAAVNATVNTPCNNNGITPGTSAMDTSGKEILTCLPDSNGNLVWRRGGTSNVNLSGMPTCTPGQGLHFDGTNFSCANPISVVCQQGQILTYSSNTNSYVCTTPVISVNGICGTTQYQCTAGIVNNKNDNGTTSTWDCDGSGTGTNATGCNSSDGSSAPSCPTQNTYYSPEDFTNTYEIGAGTYTNCMDDGTWCNWDVTDGCNCYEMATQCLTGTTCYRFDPDPTMPCTNNVIGTQVDNSFCEVNGVFPTSCTTQGPYCWNKVHDGACASGNSP
jgi:hypothetical protein